MSTFKIIEDILFLDIETVPAVPSYDTLTDEFKQFWDKKSKAFLKEDETPSDIYNRAGIYSEFGKIICISVGVLSSGITPKFRLKSFYGKEEKVLLESFRDMLIRFSAKKEVIFCGHNLKEFDLPYIARRMLINDMPLPEPLKLSGKKPWEIKHLDTMELWKFGDFKHSVSLDLLVNLFNIPSPKDDIDGSKVADTFYLENDLNRIVKYCEKDVVAVAQLFLKLNSKPIMTEPMIESVTEYADE